MLWSFGKVLVFAVVDHPDPLLLRLHRQRRPGRRRHGGGQGGPDLDRGHQHRRLLPQSWPSGAPPPPCGSPGERHADEARRSASRGSGREPAAAYGVVFLVVLALLVAFTVAIYHKAFADVVHVTLRTDRVGNQLAPAGRREAARGDRRRGARRSAPTASGPPSTSRCSPTTVGRDPGQRRRPAAARRRCSARSTSSCVPPPDRRRTPLSEGDVIAQDRTTTAIELERVLDDLLPLLRDDPAGRARTPPSTRWPPRWRAAASGSGDNLELVDGYFTRLNPELPDDPEGHLAGWPTSSRDLRRRRPRPGAGCCANFAVTTAPSRTSRTR